MVPEGCGEGVEKALDPEAGVGGHAPAAPLLLEVSYFTLY